MKIGYMKDYKRRWTVKQFEAAQEVVQCMKQDESTSKDLARIAAKTIAFEKNLFGWGYIEILKASAEVARNEIVAYNRYTDTSGDMDVLIKFCAEIGKDGLFGYISGKCWLSDIWNLGTDGAGQALLNNSYIRIYNQDTMHR